MADPPTVFVTRQIPAAGLALLHDAGVTVRIGERDPARAPSAAAVLEGASTADVIISLLTERIDERILALPRLRGVANMAVGFDNVDIDAATRHRIPVSNTPGVLTESTADLTWALLLAVTRRVPEAHAYMTTGRFRNWGPELLLGRDVGTGPDGRRKTLGIIGYGRIGAAVARRARGFDMHVLAHGRDRARIETTADVTFAELDELLQRSDFVSLHVPLSPATHHLIGAAELRAMRPTAFLINTSRGAVVDEAALVQALREGWIAGAGLDVYEREPAMAPGLETLTNVVRLPHVASATIDTRSAMATIAATNALCHLHRERAPNVVNPGVYE